MNEENFVATVLSSSRRTCNTTAHTTLYRWVQHYAPELDSVESNQRFRMMEYLFGEPLRCDFQVMNGSRQHLEVGQLTNHVTQSALDLVLIENFSNPLLCT